MGNGRIRVVSIMEAQFVTGPAKNLLEFAQRSRDPGHGLPGVDLSVITYHRDPAMSPSDNPFIAAAERIGIAVDVVHEEGRFDRSVIPQLVELINRRDPDIVQTHNTKSHFLLRYSGLYRSRRWLAFHHGYTATDLKMRLYHQLDRWSLQAPHHLVTVCGPFAKQLNDRGISSECITIRHNAVQPFSAVPEAAVAALRQSIPAAQGVPLLLMVSRLSHEKGHLDCLQALASVRQRGIPFHLVIVGEGLERAPIERTLEQLNLRSVVTLAGQQNDPRPYYAAASLFLMPSHSEGSPNALLEAMAAGVPAIASAVGGIPEIATHEETALLVPPRAPGALAAAIERLLSNPAAAQELAERAKAATARFNYEAYHRGILQIYERVLARSAALESARA